MNNLDISKILNTLRLSMDKENSRLDKTKHTDNSAYFRNNTKECTNK